MSAQTQSAQLVTFPEEIRKLSNNTLVVGDLTRWESEGRMSHDIGGFQFVDIHSLTEDVIRQSEPEIILSPLIADGFDAVDVAAKLVTNGFRGKYRAISDSIPTAEMVRREVVSVADGLDFDLLLVPSRPD
mgnify:CR=1 FL=1